MQQNDKVVGNSGADLAGILKGEIELLVLGLEP